MTSPTPPLRAGVFAAGFGSRLRKGPGLPGTPKALTPIAGRPLIDWILEDLDRAGVVETVMIINERSTTIRDHVDRLPRHCAVRWIVETTPSSMHSFLRLVEDLSRDGDAGPFLLSTVDTIAPPGTYRRFAELARRGPSADVVLALTHRMDDENPLRMDIGSARDGVGAPILAVGRGTHATAGYYFVRSSVLREAAAGRAAHFSALRVFLGHLFDTGYRFTGIGMPDSIDVDRPADVEAAERLLRASMS